MREEGKGAILEIDLYQRGGDKSVDYPEIKEIKNRICNGRGSQSAILIDTMATD
ncbi:hypothetical protein BS78_10G050500 [Paspalum vaginatum]|nr:hypothetical protein BS78_10G050500 [Paspalum vaginatum]